MRKAKRPVLLPIVPKVRAALDDCRKRTVMSAYVLLTPEGKPYSESTIKRYFKTAKAIAGITRRFRFHDRRHTFASTSQAKASTASRCATSSDTPAPGPPNTTRAPKRRNPRRGHTRTRVMLVAPSSDEGDNRRLLVSAEISLKLGWFGIALVSYLSE
jgi:integrase